MNVKCSRCGYVWYWKGKFSYITCPSCRYFAKKDKFPAEVLTNGSTPNQPTN